MITITRAQARRLGLVFRRAPLGIAPKGPLPPLVLTAGGRRLRANFQHGGIAVEFAETGSDPAGEAISVPLEALTACAGRGDAPVAVEAAAADRTAVRWEHYGVPQVREYPVTPADALPPFPGPPAEWADHLDGLLAAFADATATAADRSTRYALDCLLLRGSTGELIATDGRQLLSRGGFPFPWGDDVLIRRSPVFAARGLPRDRPVSVGRTPTHVVLKTGPWSLAFATVTGARFPDTGRVIPDPRWVSTRLEIDPGDAAFLAGALDRLPGAADLNAPATLDLNGCVAVRAARPTGAPSPSWSWPARTLRRAGPRPPRPAVPGAGAGARVPGPRVHRARRSGHRTSRPRHLRLAASVPRGGDHAGGRRGPGRVRPRPDRRPAGDVDVSDRRRPRRPCVRPDARAGGDVRRRGKTAGRDGHAGRHPSPPTMTRHPSRTRPFSGRPPHGRQAQTECRLF